MGPADRSPGQWVPSWVKTAQSSKSLSLKPPNKLRSYLDHPRSPQVSGPGLLPSLLSQGYRHKPSTVSLATAATRGHALGCEMSSFPSPPLASLCRWCRTCSPEETTKARRVYKTCPASHHWTQTPAAPPLVGWGWSLVSCHSGVRAALPLQAGRVQAAREDEALSTALLGKGTCK